jgi:hypothetical protein
MNTEHLSLTNRSSYDSSRSFGGRAPEVAAHWREAAQKTLMPDKRQWLLHDGISLLNNLVYEGEYQPLEDKDWYREVDQSYRPTEPSLSHPEISGDVPGRHLDRMQVLAFNKHDSLFYHYAWNYLTKSQYSFEDCQTHSIEITSDCSRRTGLAPVTMEYVVFEYCWWSGSWILVDPKEPMWKRIIMRPLRDNEEMFDFEDDFESTVYGENIAGYNGNSGIQILQVAIQSLLQKGALEIRAVTFPRDKGGPGAYRTGAEAPSPYDWKLDHTLTSGLTPIQVQLIGITDPESAEWKSKMRTTVKPETGGKARIFTIQEWDRTIALQPLGHFLIECLKSLPETNASLSRENTGWEWAQDMAKNPLLGSQPELLRRLFIMTNDLDQATDYGDFRVGKAILLGFLQGIGSSIKGDQKREIPMHRHPYLRTAIEILCSGVMMETVGAQAQKASLPPKKQRKRK